VNRDGAENTPISYACQAPYRKGDFQSGEVNSAEIIPPITQNTLATWAQNRRLRSSRSRRFPTRVRPATV